ncbi:MAG: cation:H+ antiporter [Dasania sp.]|jgi:cation:H+ antiporter
MEYILIFTGLIMLFIGGEILVSGSAALAHRLQISPIIVGVVIVGFGTSAPELLVSIRAALDNIPALAVGNVIGSNICNIALILGISSLISPIIPINNSSIKRDICVMLVATLLLAIIAYLGYISRWIAGGFLLMAVSYLYNVYRVEKKIDHSNDNSTELCDTIPITSNLLKITFGIVLLIFGPKFLIQGGITIAREFGLSEAIIGLSMVAIGTSLPELAAGISASLKKQSGILLGNIIGSNIFNILLILGTTALIKPFDINPRFLQTDIPFAALCALSLAVLIFAKLPINRIMGGLYLSAYIIYIVTMI